MTATEVPTSAGGNPIGFGRMLRKEDARFLRGKGNYVDDVKLPGMLHAAVLRSPYAHARIKSIDTTEAKRVPGVIAIQTGADALEHVSPMPAFCAETVIQHAIATEPGHGLDHRDQRGVPRDQAVEADGGVVVGRLQWRPLQAHQDEQDGEDAQRPGRRGAHRRERWRLIVDVHDRPRSPRLDA